MTMQDLIAHVDRYLPRSSIESLRISMPKAPVQKEATRYTAQRLAGGCVVYWLGRRELGRTV
jgi:hypothetical protein